MIIEKDELLERYAAGERNFKGGDLIGTSLKGTNLSGANLNGANLDGANLSGTTMPNGELHNCQRIQRQESKELA